MAIDAILKDLGIGVGGISVKSVQRGTFDASQLQTDVPINNINKDKSVLMITIGVNSATEYPYRETVRGQILDNTTLRFNMENISTTPNLEWQVVEFENVRSIQTGSVQIADTVSIMNVPINAVDLNKAILFFTFTNNSSSSTNVLSKSSMRGNLTTPTNIFLAGYSAGIKSVNWQVIELI